MPFGPVFSPSIGLSLLKAGLARTLPVSSRVHYFADPLCGSDRTGLLLRDCRRGPARRSAIWPASGCLRSARLRHDRRRRRAAMSRRLLRTAIPRLVIARLLRARERVDTFLDECLAALLRDRPRIVGFTSIFQQHAASLALARRLKRPVHRRSWSLAARIAKASWARKRSGRFRSSTPWCRAKPISCSRSSCAACCDGASVSGLPGVQNARSRRSRSLAAGRFRQRPDGPRDGLPALADYRRLLRAIQGQPLRPRVAADSVFRNLARLLVGRADALHVLRPERSRRWRFGASRRPARSTS